MLRAVPFLLAPELAEAITGKIQKKTFCPRKIDLENRQITGRMAKNV